MFPSPTSESLLSDAPLRGQWARGVSGRVMRICSDTPDENGWVEVEHPGMPTPTGFVRGRMRLDRLEIVSETELA